MKDVHIKLQTGTHTKHKIAEAHFALVDTQHRQIKSAIRPLLQLPAPDPHGLNMGSMRVLKERLEAATSQLPNVNALRPLGTTSLKLKLICHLRLVHRPHRRLGSQNTS